MRIHFQRMGGFGGLRLSTTIESRYLDEEVVQVLEEEVEQSQFFALPERIQTPEGGADRFEYHITVEWQHREHTVVVGEAAMPDSLRPLVQHLEVLMRTRR